MTEKKKRPFCYCNAACSTFFQSQSEKAEKTKVIQRIFMPSYFRFLKKIKKEFLPAQVERVS